MATIPFAQIPQNLRIPGFFAEVNNARANTAGSPQRALIIGQITSAGKASPNVPLQCFGAGDAIAQGGAGSMLAIAAAAYLANNPFGEVWYLPLADPSGANAAAQCLFSGTATAAGTVSLYIAGNLVAVPVTVGMTATQVATAVAAAISANPNLPVTATSTAGGLVLPVKNVGLAGNDLDVRLNYKGASAGEVLPAGLVFTLTFAATGGSGVPTLTTGLANLVDQSFDFIVTPYTDNTSVAALTAFMNDVSGRWSWNSQIYGHVFGAIRGTASALTTFGVALNDPHSTYMGFFDSPSLSYVWGAAVAGATAAALANDYTAPIAGMAGLAVQGVLAPPLQSRFLPQIRNSLLFDGVSTFTVVSGQVFIESLISTYQLNSQGQPDNSYLKVETLFSLMFNLRDLQAFVVAQYGSVKLAADGVKYAPGANVATPSSIKAAIIGRYRFNCMQGFAQQPDVFAAALVVQINPTNPDRVDVLFTPILIGILDQFATLCQFRLQ